MQAHPNLSLRAIKDHFPDWWFEEVLLLYLGRGLAVSASC